MIMRSTVKSLSPEVTVLHPHFCNCRRAGMPAKALRNSSIIVMAYFYHIRNGMLGCSYARVSPKFCVNMRRLDVLLCEKFVESLLTKSTLLTWVVNGSSPHSICGNRLR